MTDLATALLPVLQRSLEARFNVFDVMHHGTHEKQISNVFRWLLETEGNHHLGDMFLRIFIDEVNRGLDKVYQGLADEGSQVLVGRGSLAPTAYLVLQEVNISAVGGAEDIADLVLKNDDAVIVVENYFTSDGHGHSYGGYLRYSQLDGRQGAVVLLCHENDSTLQADGWQYASVVTYGRLLDTLLDTLRVAVEGDRGQYQQKHPEPYSFIDQMHRKFVKGRGPVEDHEVLDFVIAMCATGQAGRYGEHRGETSAAERFANDVAEQARERFGEGREMLGRVKVQLRNFSAEVLSSQLNETLGDGYVSQVSARYSGTYQWTVNFDLPDDGETFSEARLQLKFGPSAWFANEKDPNWTKKVDPEVADYSRLFLTRAKTKEVRQSAVTLQEVLDGLEPSDRRLQDEIVQLLSDSD
ncbi:MAG: PD-(D/E)XK nuclease family protein [Actinomycetota bacterium]